MTASLHKLTAGSGYDYLTRQVAAQDTTEKGHASLASYYSEKGETPGSWWGSGLAGLGDVAVGDLVSAEQMKALFGGGFHPNMAGRMAALPVDASLQEIWAASRLGAPFKVFSGATAFQKEVAVRCSVWEQAHPGAEVPVDVRAEIRNDIARKQFVERFGRVPGPLELSSQVARLSRDPSTACAGFDVTFTPVKSVSTLWAVAPVELAARIEEAHNAAVVDALRFLEQRALFTRCGADGVRQVDVTGLVAAMFVHRDSRAGDPNLHTHAAIANKVQTMDGKWLAIDGRLIFKAKVAVSETYNTQLEAHLAKLGIRFHERGDTEQGKRPVREVMGVPTALLERWSSRRVAIVARQTQLAARFQSEHGRPPTPVEAIKLAQQATLETRDAKHEPRTVAQQRATWWAEAQQVVGEGGINTMVAAATAAVTPVEPVTEEWVAATAHEIVAAVEGNRATWQVWHLRAEASRRARECVITPDTAKVLTEHLLQETVRLSEPVGDAGGDDINEPAVLRRRDGASVYTVAGSQLFTSGRVLAAESQIVELSGQTDGRRVTEVEVSLALLASTANGVTLNAGQTNLVRQMASSGARVQLALAAAGAGKTTALKVLAEAWREGGGTVLGLAPSAVAASVLRDQTGEATTLAKYVWDLDHERSEALKNQIGPDTLVIIDEAGMADTIRLATVIEHVVARGGSVRLVGDDQQLAAISAGGVLRDIAEIHGAVELTELLRFTDPAEAAASLAFREGRPEALGFYLDADRIHAGSQESSLEQAFHDWATDRQAGLDALMLAGTRDTVTDLNRRARASLLALKPDADAGEEVVLMDGNRASAGDVIITRLNDRRLAITATDWVKNGDRWVIQHVTGRGVVRARHCDSGRSVTLPTDYVARYVQLGYAVTVHAAQGLTVDVTRGVLTGNESRQQLYVMATRGRQANHLYVPVVGDGDEHSVVHPTTLQPETALDVLQTVLARDGSARSATTEARDQMAPSIRLGHAAPRYADALNVAAEVTLSAGIITSLDEQADQIVDGLTSCAAWPALRSTLLLHAVDGRDPLTELRTAAAVRELGSADDPAAVLTWRIPPAHGTGPLPWLPAVPTVLMNHRDWGPYLSARLNLVTSTAHEVREAASHLDRPEWALPGQHLTQQLIGDVELWRAGTSVDATDRRPLGPVQLGTATRTWQRHLESRLHTGISSVWVDMLTVLHPEILADPFVSSLSHRIAALHRAGVSVSAMLAEAAADRPLPAEQPAAALWWRLSRHLTHTQSASTTHAAPISWAAELLDIVGDETVVELESSPWWPTLIQTVNDAVTAGIALSDLLATIDECDTSAFDDRCQALMWRAQQLATIPPPVEEEEPPHPDDIPPEDLYRTDTDTEQNLFEELRQAAWLRETTEPDFTEIKLRRDFAAADRWADTPHTEARLAMVNYLAAECYASLLPGSWAHEHLTQRLHTDIAGDTRFRAGYAPNGWTHLVTYLRLHRITDDEMLTAGVATRTRDGRLIDKFRDRLIFPITADGTVLGFVGRRNPDRADDTAGPKYLNTATTPLFSKRDILFGQDHLTPNTVPVIVEGPLDAIAITLAGQGRFVGVAPLGTALTHEQALTIATGQTPVIGTDADTAGILAAENAFWVLAAHRIDPTRAALPASSDPADILHKHGPEQLHDILAQAHPQADHMTHERLSHLPRTRALTQLVEIQAARPTNTWSNLQDHVGEAEALEVKRALVDVAKQWSTTPLTASEAAHDQTRQLRQRLQQPPEKRWERWAKQTNPALVDSNHWQSIAHQLDRLNPNVVNMDRLAQQLGRSPADMVLAILNDLNDPDPDALRARKRLQQEVGPSTTTVNERHLRHRRMSRSTSTRPR